MQYTVTCAEHGSELVYYQWRILGVPPPALTPTPQTKPNPFIFVCVLPKSNHAGSPPDGKSWIRP